MYLILRLYVARYYIVEIFSRIQFSWIDTLTFLGFNFVDACEHVSICTYMYKHVHFASLISRIVDYLEKKKHKNWTPQKEPVLQYVHHILEE